MRNFHLIIKASNVKENMVYQRNGRVCDQKLSPSLSRCQAKSSFHVVHWIVSSGYALGSGNWCGNKATPGLLRLFQPRKPWQQPVKLISPSIFQLGLYRNRPNFSKKWQQLLDNFDGQNIDCEELESLAGWTQDNNVVMSVTLDSSFAVNTVMERICKHHDIVKKSATPLEVESGSWMFCQKSEWLAAHQAMIYFGPGYLPSKNPECDQYPQLYPFD